MRVHATGVSVEIDGVRVVHDAAIHAAPGTVVGLVGPNGSGKSSLLRAVYRALKPVAGRVMLDDREVWELTAKAAAHRTAVVLQDDGLEFEFTVRETVDLGRVPHRTALRPRSLEDARAVDEAMSTVGVTELADRYISTLSGGERQRVYLARALAQQTPVLVLDEPTNHLDILAQIELLELLTAHTATVVIALHDLNLAAAHCDTLVVIDAGRVVAHGAPAEVLHPALIARVYGVTAEAGTNPLTGTPSIHLGAPIRRRGHTPSEPDPPTYQGARTS